MYHLSDFAESWTGEEIFEIFKPYGYTPKEIVDKVKSITGAKKGAFSGRLDPMACGCLKIFLNESCKLANKINESDKTYRFSFAFYLTSSSGDLLGIPEYKQSSKGIRKDDIIVFLETIKGGTYDQRMPALSSYQVANEKGEKHPLWWWTQNDRLDEVELPSFKKILYDYELIGFNGISLYELSQLAIQRISLINKKHMFNQDLIMTYWRHLKFIDKPILTFEMKAKVSSGFYIRQLVKDIGTFLGVETLTIEIERLSYF
uniref:tRNA pseudouridine(55) synthase n=1 Tax=viral metagenome TaxID=1070528 RepID=A0A6C0KUZ1_9ZZZZ